MGTISILYANDIAKGKEQIVQSLSGINPKEVETALRGWNFDIDYGRNHSSFKQCAFARDNSSNLNFELFTQDEIQKYSKSYNQGRQI